MLVRGERPVAFHGEVSPGQRRAPRKPANDAGLETSGGEQRRLHGEGLELVGSPAPGVDEDRPSVGPRRLAGLAGCHRKDAAGEGGGQQAESPHPVVVDPVTLQGGPSSPSRRCFGSFASRAQPVMPRRPQISATSSKMDAGTLKGAVADTSERWAATSSAVGALPGSASQPSASPMKTRA